MYVTAHGLKCLRFAVAEDGLVHRGHGEWVGWREAHGHSSGFHLGFPVEHFQSTAVFPFARLGWLVIKHPFGVGGGNRPVGARALLAPHASDPLAYALLQAGVVVTKGELEGMEPDEREAAAMYADATMQGVDIEMPSFLTAITLRPLSGADIVRRRFKPEPTPMPSAGTIRRL